MHSGRIATDEVVRQSGMPVTSPARTAVDIARSCSVETAVVAADFALQERRLAAADLGAALSRARHVGGIGRARRALDLADGLSESPGETRVRLALIVGGLPRPALQIRVIAPDGRFVGRVDLGYPELGVLIEFDGAIKYGGSIRSSGREGEGSGRPGRQPHEVVIAEKRREDRLRDLGSPSSASRGRTCVSRPRWLPRSGGRWTVGRRTLAAGGLAGTWFVEPAVPIRPAP